jgi:histidinol phosphatase-like enzyme
VHVRDPRPNGFPPSDEADDLDAIEASLCGLLETGNDALCALVITNNGLRDFIFYTRGVTGVHEKLENNLSIFKGFVTEFAIEPARDWEIYNTFAGQMNPPTNLPETKTSASA